MAHQRLLGVPVLLWIALFALADLALAWPGLDLALAGLFHDPVTGFGARGQPWERLAYHSIGPLLTVLGLGLISHWLWVRRRADGSGRRVAFLLALLLLIPGLLVNQILKDHWGRPRPVQVAEFGGTRAMVPAFVPSAQGGGAFCSGHAAAAAWVVAVAVAMRGARSAWTLLALAYAGLVGFARIAAGAHFASDVLTAFLLVWIGWYLLHPLSRPPHRH